MTTSSMLDLHQEQAPWAWALASGVATTLQAQSTPRWLVVGAGCVWATRRDAAQQAEDIWLAAGDSLLLPAGSAWVLEGWPQARVSLAQSAPHAAPGLSRGEPAARHAGWAPGSWIAALAASWQRRVAA